MLDSTSAQFRAALKRKERIETMHRAAVERLPDMPSEDQQGGQADVARLADGLAAARALVSHLAPRVAPVPALSPVGPVQAAIKTPEALTVEQFAVQAGSTPAEVMQWVDAEGLVLGRFDGKRVLPAAGVPQFRLWLLDRHVAGMQSGDAMAA